MQCPNCGREASAHTQFCGSCGTSMAPVGWSNHPASSASAPMSAAEPWSPGYATTNAAWQPQSAGPVSPPPGGQHPVSGVSALGVPDYPPVMLAPGEVIKREWLVSRMKRLGWIDSCLTVTDARVIYRARAKSFLGFSSNWREVQIQDVSGAALQTRRGLTPLSLLSISIGFILAIFAINLLNSFIVALTPFSFRNGGSTVPAWTVLLYLLTILITIGVLVARYFSKEITLVIFARSIDASPIGVTGSRWRQHAGILAAVAVSVFSPVLMFAEWLGLGDAAAATDQADPAATQTMYNEFGALVLELQSRGVLGAQAST